MLIHKLRFLRAIFLTLTAITIYPVAAEPVSVVLFYQPGCPECEVVRREVLPDLGVVFPGQYRLEALDVSVASNAGRLIAVQEEF